MRNAFGGLFGYAGDHHPGIAVANQNDVVQVFILEHSEHVLDVGIQSDLGAHQVLALSKSG
jgi:hypothetical protein